MPTDSPPPMRPDFIDQQASSSEVRSLVGRLRQMLIVEQAIYDRLPAQHQTGEASQRLAALEKMIHEGAVFWKHCRTEEGWRL